VSIEGLTIIGERINPGFASSKALLEKQDLKGLQDLAVTQAQKGANYLSINVGEQATTNPAFLAEVIRAVQAVVDVPLAFDYPNAAVQETCLKTYDASKARGRRPIVNSIGEPRWDMVDVLKIQPTNVVLMASERLENGVATANNTAADIAATGKRMVQRLCSNGHNLKPDNLFIDVSLCPLASDTERQVRRTLDAVQLLGSDPDIRGIHMVVGLSNLGVLLPKTALDGSRLSVKIECSFLTLAMPMGLDTILGTAGREYRFLPPDDFVFTGFKEAIEIEGFDALMRVQQLYRKDDE
jgi:cobalamin-dependent methionine synthase I